MSADQSVLGIVTGTGPMNSSASIMALGLDPRFDLSKAYWIINGIAGADPEDASLGSAAWANYVLDGDLVYEVDPREAPADWPYGRLAIGAKRPNELPARESNRLAYELNPTLVEWAYKLTKDLKLMETPEMVKFRAAYKSYPNAMKPPFVLKGDDLGSGTYWHGKMMNRWANEWVKLLTHGKGNYVMTEMEDHGMATALMRLSKIQRIDFQRVLFLRTASNYCMQAPGQSVQESLTSPYVAGVPALESAHRVGSTVLHELLKGWNRWQDKTPGD
jgi:purine nucleoside permease